jgi:hypothetical protein
MERRMHDLAMCNLAIDSKLPGCDLVALRVDDVATNGHAVRQSNHPPEDCIASTTFDQAAERIALVGNMGDGWRAACSSHYNWITQKCST